MPQPQKKTSPAKNANPPKNTSPQKTTSPAKTTSPQKRTSPAKRTSLTKRTVPAKKERLIPVIPSGKREASAVDLIFDVVRQIPRGRVTTYGAIAKVLDLPNARMVGRAMRSVDDKGKPVPAQRVVTASGTLSHDSTGARRRALLKEGVELKGDRIIDFAKRFWDPAAEL